MRLQSGHVYVPDLITSVPQINGVRFARRMAPFGDDSAKREDAEAWLDLRAGAACCDTERVAKSYGKTLPQNAVGSPRKRFFVVAVTGGQRKKGHYYNEEKSPCFSSACFYQSWVGAQP